MKMYLTKYALAKGEILLSEMEDGSEGRVREARHRPGWATYYGVGREAHETEDAARAAVETARQKRIASLRKRIAKLEKLSFRVVEAPE